MQLVKVSDLKVGQYCYEPDSMRHFCRLPYSRRGCSFKLYDVINDCYVEFYGDELVSIPF